MPEVKDDDDDEDDEDDEEAGARSAAWAVAARWCVQNVAKAAAAR